jgi:hypothetical protein
MTAIRFSGGQSIEVDLALDDVRNLLQKALARNALLELENPQGEMVIINPQQVQFLQNGSTEPFPGGSAGHGAVSA